MDNATDIPSILRGLDAKLARDRRRPEQLLSQDPVAALGPIEEFLPRTQHWQARLACLKLVERCVTEHSAAVGVCVQSLTDRSFPVRKRACQALARARATDALPALERLLEHPHERTRAAATAAIDAIRSPETVVKSNRRCGACGYNMRGLPRFTTCPECGELVGSLRMPRRPKREAGPALTPARCRRAIDLMRRDIRHVAIVGAGLLVAGTIAIIYDAPRWLVFVLGGLLVASVVVLVSTTRGMARWKRRLEELEPGDDQGKCRDEGSSSG